MVCIGVNQLPVKVFINIKKKPAMKNKELKKDFNFYEMFELTAEEMRTIRGGDFIGGPGDPTNPPTEPPKPKL